MAAHRALDVIDRPSPAGFEALIRLVKRHFDVPVVALNRLDEAADELVAEDLLADPALEADPRVASSGLRFLATRRLRDAQGRPVGAMVLADDRPRDWTPEDRLTLDDFVALAEIQWRDALVREERDALLSERIAALEEAHVLRDQFLSILSHELRTPLNGIQGFASVLEDGLGGELNERQLAYVSKILNSSEAMLGLVNNLLDMSRVQAGVFSIVPTATDLRPLLEQSATTERAVAAGKGIALTASVPADLPPVKADPTRVAQILRHLVGNAIKYTPPGGAIALRAGVADGAVCLEVSDSGPGIDPDRQADIFEPFTQIDMSRTRAHGGLGLGLPIVKALVAAHGGAVEVVSAPGKGATFRFTLPLAKKPGDGVD